MMNHTLCHLRSTLSLHTRELARAAAIHPALAPYESPREVLAALSLDSALSPAVRDNLVRALVAARQACPHPLWPALLLLAFAPLLRRLGGRLRGAAHEDLDEDLVLSLLDVTARVPTTARRMVLSIGRETARQVFQRVRAKAPHRDAEPLDEARPDVPWPSDPPAFVQCAAREALEACARFPGATQAALERAGIAAAEALAGSFTPSERRRESHRRVVERTRKLARVREELRARGR